MGWSSRRGRQCGIGSAPGTACRRVGSRPAIRRHQSLRTPRSPVAGDIERHRKIGPVEEVPFRRRVDLRRLGRLGRGQHDVETARRGLQFGAQFAPPAHCLDIIDAGDQGAQCQPAAQALAEVAEPSARPLLISRRTLGHRVQRPACCPVLQRRKLHLAQFRSEVAKGGECGVDATLARAFSQKIETSTGSNRPRTRNLISSKGAIQSCYNALYLSGSAKSGSCRS